MNMPGKKKLWLHALLFVEVALISGVISWTALLINQNAPLAIKSTTILTPYPVFEQTFFANGPHAGSAGIIFYAIGLLGNTVFLFVLTELVWLLAGSKRKFIHPAPSKRGSRRNS